MTRLKTSDTYLFQIFLVLVASVDDQRDVQSTDADHRQIDGLVLGEISIGKDVVPIDRCWQYDETTGKGCQMRGETVSLIVIGQRSHLKEQ